MSNTLLDPSPSPFVAREQRTLANHLGMWVFLATEILFFGGLFACYTVYRWAYPAEFAAGSHHLEYWIGTLNTGLLLTSSLFVALADLAVKENARGLLRTYLLLAWVLGAAFLCLKGYEYSSLIAEHKLPGPSFDPQGQAPQVQLFLYLYFAMTGLHAVHMIVGLWAIAWLLWLNHRRIISPERPDAVAMVGLYWHFVDCVWVFLYPLLYLIGRKA
jgi:cytochrome c oxidase subunit III